MRAFNAEYSARVPWAIPFAPRGQQHQICRIFQI
jgi:hypothetical protein